MRGSQSPFAGSIEESSPTEDALVRRAAKHLRDHATARGALSDVWRKACVTERTLARRFQASLGMSPLTYLQSQRVARARTLLERTTHSFEAIVNAYSPIFHSRRRE